MNSHSVPANTKAGNPPPGEHRLFARENLIPFVLVTALFFLWGIPNNLNDVLIRQFMKSFELSRFQAGLVQSAFYLGYFLLSMPAAMIMKKFGYKAGLVTGLFLYAGGTFLFWPAAIAGRYSLFLGALFVIASGLAFLETGSNSFIAQLGDPVSSERRLNFSQAFNPLGAICGVLVGTVFIFSGVELTPDQVASMKAAGTLKDYLHHETMRVVDPYLVVGVVVFIWAILIIRTKFPTLSGEEHEPSGKGKGHIRELLHYPHFLQAVAAQFFYIGAQVGTWSFFIQYIQQYTYQNEKIAGYLLTGTLVAFGVGRFASSYAMKFYPPNKLMGHYSVINVVLVAIAVLSPGWIGVWTIFLTSFFMSLMFPTIFALGLKELGPNTKIGGSLIVMAIIGGAIFTPVMGLVSEASKSMAVAMLIPLGCYVFVAYYSYFGSKVRAPVSPAA